jgi:hypothetical protein
MVDFVFEGTFEGSDTQVQTKSIAYKPLLPGGSVGSFRTATVRLPDGGYSDLSLLTFSLSADGGNHWEITTLNTRHQFVNSGDDLRLKIEGVTGEVLVLGSKRLIVDYTYS